MPTERDTLLGRRYGGADASPHQAGQGWNETLQLLLNRRSVRAYTPDPLPPGALEAIVAAAQSAATSSNLQAWSVVAVEDPARKARLARLASDQAFIHEAPLLLVWIADLARSRAIAEAAGVATEALDHLELLIVALIDATLAAQNAATAAESLGLGTVYIGAMRNRPEDVAAELALPPLTFALFGLSVGWPDPARPTHVKPRLPQPPVLHRETYTPLQAQAPAIAAYDAALKAFQRAEAIPEIGWTARVATRVGPLSSLSGRERLREVLTAFGFRMR